MDEIKQTLLDFGSYAGLAAFIGLAILAMLYFSQARDVRRLREWAGRAPERDAEVQQLAAQYAAQAVTDAMAQMPAAPVGVQQTVEGDVYVAVEGVGAEAGQLDEAAPAVGDEAIGEVVQEPLEQVLAEAPQGGKAVESQEGELPQPEIVEDGSPDEQQLAPEGEVLPDPVQVNGGAPTEVGSDQEEVTTESALAASAAEAAAPEQQEAPASRRPSTPAAAMYAGSAASARSSTPVVPPPSPPRPPVQFPGDRFGGAGDSTGVIPPVSRGGQRPPRPPQRDSDAIVRRAAIVLAGLAVSVAVIFGAITLFGGDAPPERANKPAPSALDSDTRINRAAVTVAVLNGTRVDGLASNVGGQVEQAGFKLGTVSNAVDHQEHIESVIYYAEGFKQEAREVSKEVAIKPVKAISEATQAADPAAQVVIVVGADIEQ